MILRLKNFLLNPEIKAKRKDLPFGDLLYLILLNLILIGTFQIFFYLTGIDISSFYKIKVEDIKENLAFFIMTAIFIAPPTEEFLFRYYLDYSTGKLWVSAILLFLVFIMTFTVDSDFENALYFLSAVFVVLMLLLKEFYNYTSAKLLIWGSILSFGLFHVSNYEAEAYTSHFLLFPLLLLPQLIGGFFLAFIRTQYRFIHCILFHAFFNFIVIMVGRLME